MKNKQIWKPTKSIIKKANITGFMERHEIRTYEELIQRTTTGIEWFWDSCVHETNINWFEPYTQLMDLSRGAAQAKWFLGGRLNIADNCVDRHANQKTTAQRDAIIWEGDCGTVKKITYQDLAAQTNQVANYLKAQGFEKGDRIALYMPMLPEVAPIFYAILKIGAVAYPFWISVPAQAVVSTCQKLGVKALFTVDGYLKQSEKVLVNKTLDEFLSEDTSIKKRIIVNRLNDLSEKFNESKEIYYHDAIDNMPIKFDTVETKSADPAFIINAALGHSTVHAIIHTHAGALAQISKEFYFNFDIKPKDVFYWVTDFTDMLAIWELIGALHFGTTLVLSEAAPCLDNPEHVLKQCENYQVTHLGISPSLIYELMNLKKLKLNQYTFKKLRVIGASGDKWDNATYAWCFENLAQKKLPIITILNEAQIMGSFLAPLVIEPIKPMSLQSPGLGLAVDSFTDAGYPTKKNEAGFLVCKKPAPSMMIDFADQPESYALTFYEKFKNVWNQRDWVYQDDDGQWFLKGHADETIKVGDVRIGLSEIEDYILTHPFVADVCGFGVPDKIMGEALICSVVLKKGIGQTKYLQQDIKQWVAKKFGRTMLPKTVCFLQTLSRSKRGDLNREETIQQCQKGCC